MESGIILILENMNIAILNLTFILLWVSYLNLNSIFSLWIIIDEIGII